MSEIKALETLHTAARNMAKGRNLENHEECDLLLLIADEIEAEIAERFMELPEGWTGEQASDVLAYWPTWDDGSPCMFGDEFTCYPKYDHKQEYEVLDRLVIFGQNHVWNRGCDDEKPHDGGYYEWNYMRPGGDGCEEYRPTKRKIAATLGGECKVVASSTDGLTTDNPKKWFELSCGHSFKLYGLDAPVACPVCGRKVER